MNAELPGASLNYHPDQPSETLFITIKQMI